MKKLALVLGSLLVVGTAVSAKEVMPAPVAAPEKVVEIVEKPVIVYRDREVTPAWRPSGSVNVQVRVKGPVEGHKKSETDWDGANYTSQLRTTASVNFTENQSLEIHNRHGFGLQRNSDDNKNGVSNDKSYLQHTYNFGKLGNSKVNARLESTFEFNSKLKSVKDEDTKEEMYKYNEKYVQVKPVFDFSEYFFKNDYVKASALELAPVYRHTWSHNDINNNMYGLYANAKFELPFNTTFQAEFDNLFQYDKNNRTEWNDGDSRSARTGQVELKLINEALQYKYGAHKVALQVEARYGTGLSYSRHDKLEGIQGDYTKATVRENDKVERWGNYELELTPAITYNYKATDFVNLYAWVGGHYLNRGIGASDEHSQRHGARQWRWQPEARLGMKVAF